jgi:Asp-tRNA(Asn)/Glu-tRNA(Gln) amidotransferase A subunit family amidase
MRSVLDRVARFEPHISATYRLSPERALAEAKASEARWRRDQPLGSTPWRRAWSRRR